MRALRWRYLLAAAAVVPLGLSTRVEGAPWPAFVLLHGGDALYATMFYFGARALPIPLRAAAALALGWCFAVETLQLVQVDWLVALRQTLPGRLVLGQGFEWVDLLRYAAGVALGVGVDLGARALAARLTKERPSSFG